MQQQNIHLGLYIMLLSQIVTVTQVTLTVLCAVPDFYAFLFFVSAFAR